MNFVFRFFYHAIGDLFKLKEAPQARMSVANAVLAKKEFQKRMRMNKK